MVKPKGFTTRAVHAWREGEPVEQDPASMPIYQTATFAFDDTESFAAVGRAKITGGYLYSRWANPTVDALARTIATLEGAQAAFCTASGMGAIHATLSALLKQGDHAVAASRLYGGTYSMFNRVLPRGGVSATLVDVDDLDAVAKGFTPETKVLYAETIDNPTMRVADLDALAEIAHAHGATFVVDGTFSTPYLLPALEHGVDVVVHAATKYLGGHHDVTAGAVAGPAELVTAIRMLAIDLGPVLAPFEAWLTLRGLQTLALRMDRICANAMAVAEFLAGRKGVRAVHYPGLSSHPQHDLAKRLMPRGFGGMLSFDVGDAKAGRRVMEGVEVAVAAASLGGVKTLLVHPRSVTHTQYSPEDLAAAGITDGMIRMSVGIEDPEDIIADLDRAIS
jgi:methionine-gamma-lyase